MKLGTYFYNGLVSKISKIRIVWLWGFFFYLNKLPTSLFSWNISVTDVNECRKLCFLFLFITKYFITIHIYQTVLSSLVYYIYFDEPVCKMYILKQQNGKYLAIACTSCTQCDVEMPIKKFAITLLLFLFRIWNVNIETFKNSSD